MFSEFDFFDDHVRIIDKLKAKIDKYFSPQNFDEKFKSMALLCPIS